MTIARALSRDRHSPKADRKLGILLAFVAGAANAGGFLAVGQYTSHMTGMVSSIADNLVLGNVMLALSAASSVVIFVLGATTTSLLASWGRRRHLRSRHALPLLIEALLLLVFGLLGSSIRMHVGVVPATVALLCFIMGLQNAVITHISNAVIRTTHLTGLLTDFGIELGRLVYLNRSPEQEPVKADLSKLGLQASLINAFGVGGFAGAIGFKALGYSATVVLAVLLLTVCWRPIVDDLRIWRRVAGYRARRDRGTPAPPSAAGSRTG